MLTLILKKLQERCPLKYPIVRNSACISPTEMLRSKDACILKFGRLVQKLFEIDRLTAKESDRAKLQYEDFLTSVQHDHKDKFQAFVKEKDCVGTFLGIYLKSNEMYESLWKVCKIFLTLSHGQAAVERSFSVNKQLLVDNLRETSLVGQKIVYDFLTYGQTAELHEFQIPNGLLLSCRSAHSRYVASLEEKKKEEMETQKQMKCKLIQEDIAEIKRKKAKKLQNMSTFKSNLRKELNYITSFNFQNEAAVNTNKRDNFIYF